MISYDYFVKEFKTIRKSQIEILEKYHGYNNLPEKEKKEFDDLQETILNLLKEI